MQDSWLMSWVNTACCHKTSSPPPTQMEKPFQVRLFEALSRCPCWLQRGWTRWAWMVPSNPTMIHDITGLRKFDSSVASKKRLPYHQCLHQRDTGLRLGFGNVGCFWKPSYGSVTCKPFCIRRNSLLVRIVWHWNKLLGEFVDGQSMKWLISG